MPGPGQYKPEVSMELLDKKTLDLTDHSAVFKNTMNRSIITNKNESPAVGLYFPEKYNSIGTQGFN